MTGPQIELHGALTGNCIRAAIALEEAALPYSVHHVDLRGGQHRQAPFLALNPAGKVPVIVDRRIEKSPLILCQSNAIIFYADERSPGLLLPKDDPAARAVAFERFFYFVTDVIAPSHAGFYLRGRNMQDAAQALDERMTDALRGGERFLADSAFMAGDRFTLADISAFTIIASVATQLPWTQFPKLERWFRAIETRPSITRGYRAFAPAQ